MRVLKSLKEAILKYINDKDIGYSFLSVPLKSCVSRAVEAEIKTVWI